MSNRKEQILDVAQDLLLRRGFSAFSYQDLSDALGIAKASVHHHFASKEDLGVALCERFMAQNASLAAECEARGDSALAMFDAFVERGNSLAATGEHCCPGGVLQAEYNALPPRVREKTNELFAASHRMIEAMLARGREAGELSFAGSTSDQAWLLMSTMHGALLSSRVHGAPVFDAVVRQLRSSLVA